AGYLFAVLHPGVSPIIDLLSQIISPGHAPPDHPILVQELHNLIRMAAVATEVLILDYHHIYSHFFVVGKNPLDALQGDYIGFIAENRSLAELASHWAAPGSEKDPIDVHLDIEGRIQILDKRRMDDILYLPAEIGRQLMLCISHKDLVEPVLHGGG